MSERFQRRLAPCENAGRELRISCCKQEGLVASQPLVIAVLEMTHGARISSFHSHSKEEI